MVLFCFWCKEEGVRPPNGYSQPLSRRSYYTLGVAQRTVAVAAASKPSTLRRSVDVERSLSRRHFMGLAKMTPWFHCAHCAQQTHVLVCYINSFHKSGQIDPAGTLRHAAFRSPHAIHSNKSRRFRQRRLTLDEFSGIPESLPHPGTLSPEWLSTIGEPDSFPGRALTGLGHLGMTP